MPATILEVATYSLIPAFVPFGVLYYTQDTGSIYIGTGSSEPPNVELVSSGGGGTPGGFNGDIQYNNSGAFGGSAGTIDASGNITLANPTAAVAGTDANSPAIVLSGNYWTGSTSGYNQWSVQDVVTGTGSNSTGSLVFTHSDVNAQTRSTFNINSQSGDDPVFQLSNNGTAHLTITGNGGSNIPYTVNTPTKPLSLSGAWQPSSAGGTQLLTTAVTSTAGTAYGIAIGTISSPATFAPAAGAAKGVAILASAQCDQTGTASGDFTGLLALAKGNATTFQGTHFLTADFQNDNGSVFQVGQTGPIFPSGSNLTDTAVSTGSSGQVLTAGTGGGVVWGNNITNPSFTGTISLPSTQPTITGAATTLTLSTGTAPVNAGGNSWVYTFAATESGAGSNAWAGAAVTLAGYTGGATGNNGVGLAVTASTTTSITVTNATGTTTNTGTPTAISSAVVASPTLSLAGTINSGTAGTLNSIADTWTLQQTALTVAPNPVSVLQVAHSGSTGAAYLQVAGGNIKNGIQFAASGGGIDVNANGWDINFTQQNGTGCGHIQGSTAGFGLQAAVGGSPVFLLSNFTTQATNCAVAFGNASNFSANSGTVVGCSIGSLAGVGNNKGFTLTPAGANSTSLIACQIVPTINATANGASTGGYTALKIAATETSLGSGTNRLLDCYAGSSGTTAEFSVDNSGNVAAAGGVTLNGATNKGAGTINLATYYANGTAGITQTAEAVGTLATTGGIVTTFTAVSDERLKVFTAYNGGLDEILAIAPIRYRWNPTGANYSGQSTERDFVGFSAQNVQAQIPQAVWESRDGYLGFDDRPVIAALVNAVKTLNARIAELEKK